MNCDRRETPAGPCSLPQHRGYTHVVVRPDGYLSIWKETVNVQGERTGMWVEARAVGQFVGKISEAKEVPIDNQ